LEVEQVRARLFDRITAAGTSEINNAQPPNQSPAPVASGPSVTQIYAARNRAIKQKGAHA
jgi:hypothetical protein